MGTLRMWQARHGFPDAPRTPGRHRRYRERDVALVLEVARLRAQGLSLAAAIERAESAHRPAPASLFAGLRRAHPEIAPTTLPRGAMLALSHALEDEYCARAQGGLLVGAFQRERFYRLTERRWRELARTAELAVALAGFPALALRDHGPVEVPIGLDTPLAREWALVVDAPGAHACLAGWEQPVARALPAAKRRFEVIWSFEPEVVRTASGLAAGLLRRLAPAAADRLPDGIRESAPASAPELRFATVLANRVVGYLAGELPRPESSGGSLTPTEPPRPHT